MFKANVDYIESISQAGDRKCKLEMNQFADLATFFERENKRRLGKQPHEDLFANLSTEEFKYANATNMLPSMDWRSKGAVRSKMKANVVRYVGLLKNDVLYVPSG